MKIIKADHCGFCFGVQRAVDLVFLKKNKPHIYILGELLHNPQFIDKLKTYGIKTVNSIDNISSGTIFIRAHGETQENIKKARIKNLKIIDATCPKVKKVHILAKKLEKDGYRVIIYGDKKHPEVIGIASNIKKPLIINSKIQAQKLNHYKKVALLSQTTNEIEKFKQIASIVKTKAENFQLENTICDATQKRQHSAKILAKKVDIMIVIGGKNSSNTQKLASICQAITLTHHIETAKELKKSWFKNAKICGITAGASTPKYIIKDIENKISNY